MVIIEKIIATEGLGGFWNDDNEAIKRGAKQDGFAYLGKPVTPGFKSIRQPSRAVPVILNIQAPGKHLHAPGIVDGAVGMHRLKTVEMNRGRTG